MDSPAGVQQQQHHKDSPTPSPSHKPPASASPRHAWVDTRHPDVTEETLEIQYYDVDDVERIHKRRKEAAEVKIQCFVFCIKSAHNRTLVVFLTGVCCISKNSAHTTERGVLFAVDGK